MINHSFDPEDLQLSGDIVASALSKPPKEKSDKKAEIYIPKNSVQRRHANSRPL